MNKLYILQGLPASGKSTYAKQMNKLRESQHRSVEHPIRSVLAPSLKIIESDAIRFMCIPEGMYHQSEVGDFGYSWLVNYYVWETVKQIIHKWLSSNCDVLLDAINLRRVFWLQYLEIAKKYGATVTGVMLNTDLEDCIIRDAQRDRMVGESVIRRMHEEKDNLSDYKDDFDQIITINYPLNIHK